MAGRLLLLQQPSLMSTSLVRHSPPGPPGRFSDSEVQRDAKMVSYDIVDKQTKPYIQGGTPPQ